jgi:hypothetical protein
MGVEIGFGGAGAVGPDGGKAGDIGDRPVIHRALGGPGIEGRQDRAYLCLVAEAQEHPAAFLAALRNAGIGQDFYMPGNTRLALAQDLRQLADGKLHGAEQSQDSQPGRVRQSAEDFVGVLHGGQHIRIYLCDARSVLAGRFSGAGR